MLKTMEKEIFGDLSEVVEEFALKSMSIDELSYDSDRDVFNVKFSISITKDRLSELTELTGEDMEIFVEIMNENELVLPEEIYGDEILGKE